MPNKVILAAVLVAFISSLAVAPAFAGKPAGGGRTSGSLAIFQDGIEVTSAAAGSAIEVRGSGFGANKTLYIGWAGQFGLVEMTTNDSGSFTHAEVAPSEPDAYTYVALKYSRKNWVVAADVTLVVY